MNIRAKYTCQALVVRPLLMGVRVAHTWRCWRAAARQWMMAALLMLLLPAVFAQTAPTITLAPATLPAAMAEVAYNQTITASGGIAPYTYALAGALPAGLTLSSSGVLSGTPTSSGTFSFTVTVTDSSSVGGPFSTMGSYSLTVSAPSISINPTTLRPGTVGMAFSETLTASGGTGPYTYAISAGALPAGLTLNSGGSIAGRPTAGGSFNLTIVATDDVGLMGSSAYILTVNPPASISITANLPAPTIGVHYSQQLSASGGTPSYSYRVASGMLPPGLALSSAGMISGTPTNSGSYSFTVIATDSSSGTGPYSGSGSFTLTVINPAPVLQTATLPAPTVGVAYSQPLSATGGTTPYSFAISNGSLPPGLSLDAATGVLSGIPTARGASTFSVTVTDSSAGRLSSTRTYQLNTAQTIATAPPVTVTTRSNAPVTIQAAANAANGPFTGVSIVTPPSSGTAVVNGLNIVYTPALTASGPITFTYALLNAAGASAPIPVTVTVNAMPVPVAQKQAVTPGGKAVTVDVTDGATGGPFTGAAVISVMPADAGSAVVTTGALKQTTSANKQPTAAAPAYAITFTPAAAFAGTAVISYTISNAVSTSAAATLQVSVAARRDPSTDPDVSGLINAQIQAARRFAAAQISNYNQRLEQLHGNGRPAFSNGLTVVVPRTEGNAPHCETLQSLSARDACQRGVVAPADARAGDGAKRAASHDARNGADAASPPDLPGSDGAAAGNVDARLAFWTAGNVDFGFANAGTQRAGFRFTTGGVTAGADYRVSDQFTVGAGLGYGHDGTDIGSSGTNSSADAFSLALYGSYRPTPSYFVDGVAGVGLMRFDSRRWVSEEGSFASGQRDGHQWFASLTTGYQHRNDTWLISPYGRIAVAENKLDPFTESGAGLGALTYFGQTVTSVSGTLGLRTEFAKPTRWGMFLPFARIEYQHDFEGQSAANLAYADLAGAGPAYTVRGRPFGRDRLQVGLGGRLRTRTLTFGLDYNVMAGMGGLQQGVRLTFAAPF